MAAAALSDLEGASPERLTTALIEKVGRDEAYRLLRNILSTAHQSRFHIRQVPSPARLPAISPTTNANPPPLRSDTSNASLISADEEDRAATKQVAEELEKMKVLTMHNMLETFDGSKKLMFLNAKQTGLLARHDSSLERMLEAFGVGVGAKKPQLVINLLESSGFAEYCCSVTADEWAARNTRWAPGVVAGRAPFLTPSDEQRAEARLDVFMSEVLIPLAAETAAVILCNAIPAMCVLSA